MVWRPPPCAIRAHLGCTITNVQIYDNTFIARTGPGEDWEAIGGRIYDSNGGSPSGIVIDDNLFEAIVNTSDTSYAARAFSMEGVAADRSPLIENNTFESNDISLGFSGDDGNDECDGDFISNTFSETTDGAVRAYQSIHAGYWTGQAAQYPHS